MSFKNIVVPYDGSSYANKAFKEALNISEKFDSKITVVTVLTGQYSAIGFTADAARRISDEEENYAEKIIQHLRDLAEKRGVKFSFKIIHDPSVSKGVVNFLNAKKPDLVVMGSHGRTGLRRLVLGSVANSVVNNAKCSVLIAR